MRFGDKGKDPSVRYYNERITGGCIPERAHRYQLGSRLAIEWIIDRYWIKTDKASGIVNDRRLVPRGRRPALHPRPRGRGGGWVRQYVGNQCEVDGHVQPEAESADGHADEEAVEAAGRGDDEHGEAEHE